MQAARRARKKSVARAIAGNRSAGNNTRSKLSKSQSKGYICKPPLKKNNKASVRKTASARAQPPASTGGRAQHPAEGGDGFGERLLAPQAPRPSGVLFDAPFTDARFFLVSSMNSRGRELQGVVDDLYDAQVMQNPEEGIRMYQRWLKALYEGGDRAIARIRHDWGEPPLPADYPRAPPLPSAPSPVRAGGGVAVITAQERAEYEARRDAAREERRSARAAAALVESAGGGAALPPPAPVAAVVEDQQQAVPEERPVYPKGVWDVPGFKRVMQVRRALPSFDAMSEVGDDDDDQQGLGMGLRTVLASLLQVLKEAGGQEERDDEDSASSSIEEQLEQTAPPPAGPGQLAGRYQPSTPDYSPPRS